MEKELRINLNTVADLKGIESVKRSFSEMERESLRAVSAQRSVSSATSDAAKSVDNLSDRIGFMGHAYVGFQAVMAGSSYMRDLTRDAIAQADTWNLLEGRLRLVTDSTQQLVSVQADLFDIAQESRTSYESNADLYARIARATQDMNKSQNDTLDVTEAISKSFIVSGAAAESAKAAVIQLGQGFASGVLRGEELNSVLEQAPRLAEAIADGMGVSVGQLKTLGEEGKLTASKVYEAIRTQKIAIEEEFDKMPKTVGQSLVVLTNQIGLTIHEFDQIHGVTVGIASAISDVTMVLSEHSGELSDYVGYVGTAVSTIIAWKIGTVALNGVQKLHAAYIAASAVATTSYSIATNTTTASVTTLTARQVAANAAIGAWNRLIAVNPYAIAGAAIVGVGIVLKNQADELRDSVRRTAVDVENLSAKALQAKITYGTIELDKVNESINNPSIMQSLFGNERIALHRRVQIENELKAYGKQLQILHEVANNKPSGGGVDKPNIPTDEELKAAAKSAEEYAKNYKSLQDTIFNVSASDHDKAIKSIEDQAKAWRDQKMPEIEISRYVSEAKSALNRKELDELGKMMTESLKQSEENYAKADQADQERYAKQIESANALYSAINELSDNWYDNEIVNISNRASEFAAAGLEDIKIVEYVNASISKIDKKRYEEQSELAKKQWEEQNAGWISFFSDFEKAMDNQIFDAMVGKWNSFGDWLKDFWSSLTTSISRSVSSQLSGKFISGMQNFLIGSPGQQSGIQNYFSAHGLFGGGALDAGSTLSAADYASVVQQYGSVAGLTITPDGTTVNSSGIITSMGGGSDMSSLLNNGGSIYSILSNGAAGLIYAPSMYMGQLAGMAYGSGLTGTGMFLGGMSNGLAGGGVGSLTGSAAWGTMAGAGLAGGVGGYALGSFGDKLFGADTKAGTYGAIGGSIGAIAGSIVPGLGTVIGGAIGSALGSAIGGMIGGKKTSIGTGYDVLSDATNIDDIIGYNHWDKKGGWFSKTKRGYDKTELTVDQRKHITGMFDAYDFLLDQLGVASEVSIRAGKYTAEAFEAALAKSFIREYTGLSETIANTTATTLWGVVSKFSVSASNPEFERVYSAWADYAKSIDASVTEAITTEVGNMISAKRSYEEWLYGYKGDNMGLLQYQSSTAAEDLNRYMQSIGVSGISIENYASAFSAAVRSDFTAETIQQWETLGDLMMRSADAAKALSDAQLRQSEEAARVAEEHAKAAEEAKRLADETKRMNEELARSRVKPADMMFPKVNDATRTASGEMLSVQLLVEIVKTLKSIQTTNQFSASGVLV